MLKKTKLTELENKIPDGSSLATKTAFTAMENKIPSVSSLGKKGNWHNIIVADVVNGRLAQTNLITKTDFDAKLSSLNRTGTSNKSKHLLVENELHKII